MKILRLLIALKHSFKGFKGQKALFKPFDVFLMLMPCKHNKEEEQECDYLHGLQCLMASAIQEQKLIQQPKHAASCAEFDDTLVWQGRG